MAIFGGDTQSQKGKAKIAAAKKLQEGGSYQGSQTSWLGPLGTIAGTVAGVALAPATGGLSLAGAAALGGMAGGAIGSGVEGMLQDISPGSPQAGGRGPGFFGGFQQALGGGLKALSMMPQEAAAPLTEYQLESPLLEGKLTPPALRPTFDIGHEYNIDQLQAEMTKHNLPTMPDVQLKAFGQGS